MNCLSLAGTTKLARMLACLTVLSMTLLGKDGPLIGRDGQAGTSIVGAGWTADSLSNIEVGRFLGRAVSYRFRALHSGTVESVRVYFIFRTLCDGCYANGDGGQVLVRLVEDDGTADHFPGSGTLASVLVTDPMKQWNRLLTFDHRAVLESGKLYHIVFANPLPNARQDYVSIDDLYARSPSDDLQPSGQDSQLTVLFKSTGTSRWEPKPQHVPIFSLNFNDGHHEGQGYIDVRRNAIVVADGQLVRESFAFSDSDHSFRNAAVRFQALDGSGEAELQLNDSDGRTLASQRVELKDAGDSPKWKTLELATPLVLTKGTQYAITVIAHNGAKLTISPLQKGSGYGFDPETMFTGGHCESKILRAWVPCLGRTDLDIPFFLK